MSAQPALLHRDLLAAPKSFLIVFNSLPARRKSLLTAPKRERVSRKSLRAGAMRAEVYKFIYEFSKNIYKFPKNHIQFFRCRRVFAPSARASIRFRRVFVRQGGCSARRGGVLHIKTATCTEVCRWLDNCRCLFALPASRCGGSRWLLGVMSS